MGDQGLSIEAIAARVERFAAMGTRIELHQFGSGDEDALVAVRRAIDAVDDALTIHRPSPVTILNERLAAGRSAAIDDPILFDTLFQVDAAVSLTGGLFDPTVQAATGGCWNAVMIDRAAARIEVSRPVAFDFGGFGKGYALDRASAILREGGATSLFLSAGESSIAVVGPHPLGGAWPVSIPHPLLPGENLAVLELEDEALSISSTAGPYAQVVGKSAMLRPSDGSIMADAVTAFAVDASGALAEAMSTALLVADSQMADRFVTQCPGKRQRHVLTGPMPIPVNQNGKPLHD